MSHLYNEGKGRIRHCLGGSVNISKMLGVYYQINRFHNRLMFKSEGLSNCGLKNMIKVGVSLRPGTGQIGQRGE